MPIAVTQPGWNLIWQSTQPSTRYNNTDNDLANVGFQNFKFNAADVVVPAGRILCKAHLSTLPEAFRLTVIYVDVEGLSYEEIAEATKTNIGTVRSRLHRGRRLLRSRLKNHADELM